MAISGKSHIITTTQRQRNTMILNALLTLLLVVSFSINAKPWQLCHEDKEYPPYISSDNQASGLLVDILEHAASSSNIELYFTALPWKRCQQAVKDGIYDGLFAMIKTPKRTKQFAFPMTQQHYINTADYVILYKRNSFLHRAELAGKLFSKQGEFNVNYYKKIKEFGLQAPAGYVVEQYIKQHNIAANSDYDLSLGIHQVAIGRLDGYIVEKRIGLAQVEALNQQDHVISSQGVLKRTYWYVPFNRDFYNNNKEGVARFWHHMQLSREQILAHN